MDPRIRFRFALVVFGLVMLALAASRRADAQSSSYTNVRVVNPLWVNSDGGFVTISTVSGTVALTPQTLADLTAPQCGAIYPLAKMHLNPDAGPQLIPPNLADGGPGGDAERSSITLVNTEQGAGRTMSCDLRAADGGFPSCSSSSGYGEEILSRGRFTWSVGQSLGIYCVACNVAGVDLGFREERCR